MAETIVNSKEIITNISKVKIFDDCVHKQYEFKWCNPHLTFDLFTGELFILNVLNGADGFPKILNLIQKPPHFTIVLNNLGQPIDEINWKDAPEEIIRDSFIQITKLVADLHASKIVHLDLKPKNILFRKMVITRKLTMTVYSQLLIFHIH